MTRGRFDIIRTWFDDYIRQFYSDDPSFQRNIELKRDHSRRVWKNAADLGRSLSFDEKNQLFIETAGLLHDIGRFEQFRRYGTFVDKKSVDHGWLGVEVLKANRVLKDLDEQDREVVFAAIQNHNKKELPENGDDRRLTFIKLLRDADKLDIWRVVTEYYCRDHDDTNNTLQLDLPDEPRMNPQNIDDLLNGRLVDLNNLQTLDDFKLLQIGWVYDMNFRRSYEILQENGYLKKIFDALPDTDTMKAVHEKVERYLEERTG